ncbi:MAG: DUF1573 domain-containing protein [Phycisphaerae bacterium]|nr:DUF1573 domain-containing protein [Phycisphaerae bacterium]
MSNVTGSRVSSAFVLLAFTAACVAAPQPGVESPAQPKGQTQLKAELKPSAARPAARPQPGVEHGTPAVLKPEPSPLVQGPFTFDRTMHEFGDVFDDQDVQTSFTMKNTSGRRVKYTAHASCGCTKATVDKTELDPGESATVTATLMPQGRQGHQYKLVIIDSDDPAQPRAQVGITAEVNPLVRMEPQRMFVGTVIRGEKIVKTAVFTGRDASFKVTKVLAPRDQEGGTTGLASGLGARLVSNEVVEDNGVKVGRATVEFTLDNTDVPGNIGATVVIETTDPRAKTIPYAVAGDVIGRVMATPDRWQLRTIAPGQEFSAESILSPRTDKPFKIVSVDVDGPSDMNLAVDFRQLDNPNRVAYAVTLTGNATDRAGTFRGTVTIKTDVGEDISIPFYGAVRATPPRAN